MSLNNTFSEKDTHYFALDLHEGAILAEPLKFKQYDHRSRVLSIELTVHNTLLSLQNARVDIWVYKPDGKLVVNEVVKENIDTENSIILVPLTRQMLTTLPKVECEIVVTYADNKVLSFPIFEVEIEDSNMDTEQVISTTEFDMFFASLVRMEQWIRDFETKYNIIDESFTTKLAEIESEKLRIIDEFEIISADLVKNDRVRFEELKQMTIGEFNTWFTQAKKDFAYAGREIESRFNQLWEKCNDLNVQMQEIVRQADEHKVVIEQLRKHAEEVKADMDAKYAEIVLLYEDGVKKLTEMQNTFNADQAARKTAFDNAQSQRTIDFEKAQSDRTKAYEDEKASRNSAYNTAEANRNVLYNKAEDNREVLFNNAERERQQSYSEKESARILAEQNRVSAENQRAENENQRIEDFNAMKEKFNIALQYRLLEK